MSRIPEHHPRSPAASPTGPSTARRLLASLALLGFLVGCPGSPGDEEGVWCRDNSPTIKFLFLDGLGVYSVLERDAAGTVTTIVDGEPYSMVVEGDVTVWYSWLDGDPYSNAVTSLVPGQELVLDSSLYYAYVAPHDWDYDVSGVDACPPL